MAAPTTPKEEPDALPPEVVRPGRRALRAQVSNTALPRNAIMAAFVSLAFVKTVTVVDEDVDIYSPADVDWAVQTRCCYESDLLSIPDAIGHRLNPMVEDDKWTRMGIDATVRLPRPDKFVRASMEDVDLSAFEITGQ